MLQVNGKNCVQVLENDGVWHVRLTEAGVTTDYPYENERFARSYADGQAARLGIHVSDWAEWPYIK